MPDFFGAPSGIIASDENIRRNVLTGLTAQKTLGEIEMQPAQKSLLESHARLYGAEAAGKEAAAKAQQQMLQLQSDFLARRRESQARDAAIDAGKAQGINVTVADIPASGFRKSSMADPLREFAAYAESAGVGPVQLAKVYKEVAEIEQKEAIAGYRSAQEGETNLKAIAKKLELVGNAASAAATSPQHYMAVRSDPVLSKMLPPGLTGDFATDQKTLRAVADASVDTMERLKFDQKEKERKTNDARVASQNSRDSAAIKLADAREKLIKERTNNLIKSGGEGSPSAVKAREELSKQREAQREARLRKEFPAAPLDPKQREVGKSYTAADGKTRFMWTRDPVSGKNVAVVLDVKGLSSAAKAAPAPVADDTEDDDGEED